MPPSEITATSVVPPPMSIIIDPTGSSMGKPAPMAAAIGSSTTYASRALALSAASRAARISTCVTPDGTPMTTRGRGEIMPNALSWAFSMKCLIIFSTTSKSAITPSLSGRTAMMLAGVRPTIAFASEPTAMTSLVLLSMATTEGSLMTIPRPRTCTRVFAVPRSMPRSRPNAPNIAFSGLEIRTTHSLIAQPERTHTTNTQCCHYTRAGRGIALANG